MTSRPNRETDCLPQWSRRLPVLIAVCALQPIAAFPSTVYAQENSFRDYFPQVETADWDAIAEGCPIDRAESESLVRILSGLENIPEKFWKEAADSNPSTLADAMAAPKENCGKVFSFSGTCQQVKPPWGFVKAPMMSSGPIPERGYPMDGQRVQIKCGDGTEAWVLAQSLPFPAVWSFPSENRYFNGQPVLGYGMFLFMKGNEPVLVSRNVHWRPIAESPELKIGSGQLELVRAGFDIELLDKARNYTDMALVPQENELFERMLAAVHAISQDTASDLDGKGKPFDLIDLVQQPTNNAGSLIQVEGTLRRYASVTIDDPELRAAIGGDQYYQLDVFVPLGNKRIQVGHDKQNNPIETSGEYGITLIATSLSDEILSARLPIRIQVPAFMLKVWEHRSLATTLATDTLRRPNPILIAVSSQLQSVAASDAQLQLFILIPSIGFGILGILGILFFVSRNRQRSFHTQQRVVENPDFGVLFEGDSDESQACP